MNDVKIYRDYGSLVLFEPISEKAYQWFDDNVQSTSDQWVGGTLAVDHIYANDIINKMRHTGLTMVEL